MKYPSSKNYTEAEDKKYIIHHRENTTLGDRKEPKSLRTQLLIQNKTKSC